MSTQSPCETTKRTGCEGGNSHIPKYDFTNIHLLRHATKSFYFTGAKEYNMLPLQGREMKTTGFALFLQKHFN